jgi:hypothetical protein
MREPHRRLDAAGYEQDTLRFLRKVWSFYLNPPDAIRLNRFDQRVDSPKAWLEPRAAGPARRHGRQLFSAPSVVARRLGKAIYTPTSLSTRDYARGNLGSSQSRGCVGSLRRKAERGRFEFLRRSFIGPNCLRIVFLTWSAPCRNRTYNPLIKSNVLPES